MNSLCRRPLIQKYSQKSEKMRLYYQEVDATISKRKVGGDFPPLVDLFLAGRLMLQTNVYFITSDFRDFPLFIFDRINLITFEDEKDNRTEMQIIEFSKTKYQNRSEELDKIEKRVNESR